MLLSSPSYVLGLFFIVCVSIIWSLASILVQYLYEDQSFDSPFLLTYIGTSLFIVLLPLEYIYQKMLLSPFCCTTNNNNNSSYYQQTDTIHGEDENDVGMTTITTTTVGTGTGSGEYESISLHNNDNNYLESNNNNNESKQWTLRDHYMAAIKIAPVWFISNYSYNASLKFTSITSSTVLACTGSLFTFLFALLLKDEQFSYWKLVGVLLGMTGSILTGLHDIETTANDSTSENSDGFGVSSIRGDALGLLSAIGYGGYAIMVRILCPKDESLMKMQVFLGFVGLWNMILLLPILIYMGLFTTGLKSLTWLVLGFLILKGLFDNVLSDYLWARSVVLTSATVASVGLGLTIPLAFVSDILKGRPDVLSLSSILGATSVLVGFILVNLGQQKELEGEEGGPGVTVEEGGEGIAEDHNSLRQQLQPSSVEDVATDVEADEITPLEKRSQSITTTSSSFSESSSSSSQHEQQQQQQQKRMHMSIETLHYSDK